MGLLLHMKGKWGPKALFKNKNLEGPTYPRQAPDAGNWKTPTHHGASPGYYL